MKTSQRQSVDPAKIADRDALTEQFTTYAERWGQEAAASFAAKCLLSFALKKQTEEAHFSDLVGEVVVRIDQSHNDNLH